jgi:hypothetical protein
MSIIDVIFFACFILFLLSAVGLTLGRLIARLLIPEPDPRKRSVTPRRSRQDPAQRPWRSLGSGGLEDRDSGKPSLNL